MCRLSTPESSWWNRMRWILLIPLVNRYQTIFNQFECSGECPQGIYTAKAKSILPISYYPAGSHQTVSIWIHWPSLINLSTVSEMNGLVSPRSRIWSTLPRGFHPGIRVTHCIIYSCPRVSVPASLGTLVNTILDALPLTIERFSWSHCIGTQF